MLNKNASKGCSYFLSATLFTPHQRPFNWIQRPAPPSCLLAGDRSALFQYHMLLLMPLYIILFLLDGPHFLF